VITAVVAVFILVAVPLRVAAQALASIQASVDASGNRLVHRHLHTHDVLDSKGIEQLLRAGSHASGNHELRTVIVQELWNSSRLVTGILNHTASVFARGAKIDECVLGAPPEVRCDLTVFCCDSDSH
jgi:hypothetical protein